MQTTQLRKEFQFKASAIFIFPSQITRLSTFTQVQQEITRSYFHSLKQILPNPRHSAFSLHQKAQSALLLPNSSYKLVHILSTECHSSPRRQQPSSQVSTKSERWCKNPALSSLLLLPWLLSSSVLLKSSS